MKFQFIAAHQDEFPVRQLCHVLAVSPSGYYAWRLRPPSGRQMRDAVLLIEIRRIHQRSRATYGSPRIHAELRAQGHRCNHKRIAHLMRQHGLRARAVRRFRRTTELQPGLPVAPNQVWTADITYPDTAEGWLYLATVLDLCSRRVVGWAMAEHMETSLVRDALQMAFLHRHPPAGLLHHSDRGRQYASAEYQALSGGTRHWAISVPLSLSKLKLSLNSPSIKWGKGHHPYTNQ